MDINEAFPEKYFKAETFTDGPLNLTIADTEMEKMLDGSEAPVVYFKEDHRGLVLNKTNAKTISSMYASDTDGWVNQPVTLIRMQTEFGGNQVWGMRIQLKDDVPQ